MNISRALLLLILISLPITLSHASLTANMVITRPRIDAGQTQTATILSYNGATPYTYNLLVYNPSGTLIFNSLSS